jgi:hypothetical protein
MIGGKDARKKEAPTYYGLDDRQRGYCYIAAERHMHGIRLSRKGGGA